jgi:quercetin dioxygenase-like cupin family protein
VTATATPDTLFHLLEAAARAPNGASGRVALAETTIRAREMVPLHAHDEDEAVRVLDGRLTIYAGADVVPLEAGETYVIRAGTAHTHRADSERATYLTLSFVRSAARYEDFARAVASPVAGWATPEDCATLAAIAAPNRIAILGPPGALPAVDENAAA